MSIGLLEGRVWTDATGRQFEASLIERKGDDLVMELPGGRRFTVKLGNLAESDRALVTGGRRVEAQDRRATGLSRPWPSEIRHARTCEVTVVEEDRESGRFVYDSPHYRFFCNVRLSHEVLRNFAVMFETTYLCCQQLPLSLLRQGRDGGRLQVVLFETEAQYHQAGGMPGSAGCHVSRTRRVMAPLSSLGLVPMPGGYRLDRERQNEVLIHELVHQLTPSVYYREGSVGWFTEGLAEYVATMPYSWGYFRVDPPGRAAKEFVSAYGINRRKGRALGSELVAPPLEQFFKQPYSRFARSGANRNYGLSLLLVHHFFHFDGQGRATRIRDYLKALNGGMAGDQALAVLLGGRSFDQLEAEIASAWQAKGITIRFQ